MILSPQPKCFLSARLTLKHTSKLTMNVSNIVCQKWSSWKTTSLLWLQKFPNLFQVNCIKFWVCLQIWVQICTVAPCQFDVLFAQHLHLKHFSCWQKIMTQQQKHFVFSVPNLVAHISKTEKRHSNAKSNWPQWMQFKFFHNFFQNKTKNMLWSDSNYLPVWHWGIDQQDSILAVTNKQEFCALHHHPVGITFQWIPVASQFASHVTVRRSTPPQERSFPHPANFPFQIL